MNKRNVLLVILVGFSYVSNAQILKVNKGSLDADSSGYFLGSINLKFNLNNRSTTGDEQVVFKGLDGTADLVYLSEKHAYILINNISYFTLTDGPLISTGYAHFRVNYLRKRKFSYETYSQIQYDDGRNMPFRLLAGGGLRLKAYESENSAIYIGLGIMNETEHWKSLDEEGALIKKNIWKTSDYISAKIKLNEHVNFNLITYYQGGYDYDSDVYRNRISGDAELTVGISDRLAFLTTFTAQYEDKPIIPINNFVYALTNGLQWNF